MNKYIINLTKFAKEAGVSKQAVSSAIKRGTLTRRKDGNLDITERNNAHYIKTKLTVKQESKPAKKKQSKPKTKPPVDNKTEDEEIDPETLPKDLESCGAIELKKHKEIRQIKKLDLEMAIKRDLLIDKSLIRNIFAKMYEIHANEFLTVKEKLIPDISAIYEITDSKKTDLAGQKIDDELWDILKHIKTEINKFLNSIKSEGI